MRCIYCYALRGRIAARRLISRNCQTGNQILSTGMQSTKSSIIQCFLSRRWRTGDGMGSYERIARNTQKDKSLPAKLSLTSNGVWSEDQCSWILENIDSISLSMDGLPGVQDHNRPLANGGKSSTILMRIINRLDEKSQEIRHSYDSHSPVERPA